MLRTKEQLLSTVVSQLLREQGMEQTLHQRHLIEAWPEVVGPIIAARTSRLFIKGKTLHVSVTSSVLKHDLQMNSSTFVEKLNARAQAMEPRQQSATQPQPIITDIQFH